MITTIELVFETIEPTVSDASVTITRLEAPDIRPAPLIVTWVPIWPMAGTTELTTPGVTYDHPSTRSIRAPESIRIRTDPVAAIGCAATTTTISVSDSPKIRASTSARCTEATCAPPPNSPVPVMVTMALPWPLDGDTSSMFPVSRKVQPETSRVRAPLSETISTSTEPSSAVAGIPMTTMLSVSLMMVVSVSPKKTDTTDEPPP